MENLVPPNPTVQTNYDYVDPSDPNSGINYGGFYGNGNSFSHVWIDIGDNYSEAYENDWGYFEYKLNCFWLMEAFPHYGHPQTYDYLGTDYSNQFQTDSPDNFDFTGCKGFHNVPGGSSVFSDTWVEWDDKVWALAGDTHQFLNIQNDPARNYVGESGDSFAFTIENPVFQFAEDTKTISRLKLTFDDEPSNFYNCDTGQSSNITFDYSIELFVKPGNATTHPTTTNGLPSLKYDFTYEGTNERRRTNSFFGTNVPEVICTPGIDLDFQFTVWEAMEIKDLQSIYGTWENFSAIVRIDDIKNEDNPGGFLGSTPLPFAGVGAYYLSFEVAYTNPASTNFLLKGGALLGGVALFFLAIASTPYYDPVRNWFSGAIE